MAVSFKVPSSPRKDIFQIENFMGVDLTNTGSNIDEVRSPNAENMVRFVPGKVRKRMGYQTQVEFSTGTDVNRAKNTSSEWKEFDISAETRAEAQTIFELYETIPANTQFNIFINIEAVGSYRILIADSSMGWSIVGTLENPKKTKGRVFHYTVSEAFTSLKAYRTAPAQEGDYLKIKNLRVCLKTSASDEDEWETIGWKAAPEDTGKTFVKTESTEAVYGCHNLKVGTFNGNRVIGVNRARNTSSEWKRISGTDTSHIYLYDVIPIGTKIKIQFDYRNATGGLPIGIYHESGSPLARITDQEGTVSVEYTAEDYNSNNIEFYGISGELDFEYRNFIVSYSDNDEEITWSKAPEDENGTFPIEDVYLLDYENTALVPNFTDAINGTASDTYRTLSHGINNEFGTAGGLTFVSFVASASAYNGATPYTKQVYGYVRTSILNSETKNKYSFEWASDNVSDRKYNIVLNLADNEYVDLVMYEFAALEREVCQLSCNVRNIEVRKATLKDSFDIFSDYYLYHIGSKIYMRKGSDPAISLISSEMNKHISKSWQIGDYLYIIDGVSFKRFNKETESIEPVYGSGYVPTITIAKSPSGGGVPLDAFNMLQPKFIEMFEGDSGSTNYQLSVGQLDANGTRVWVMNSLGDFIELEEGTDFTVYAYDGIISFTTAPGVSPITGEDNVKIQATKTISDYADRINKCTIGTLFGVNGASDRLFLSGNPDHRNWDFYSSDNDPTYFPDTGYSSLGLETSAIVGYSKVNNYLATHKDEMESEQNVLVREGDLLVKNVEYGERKFEFSDPAFKIINTIQGASAYGKYTFCNLQNEPIFLTKSGLYAITAQDITGEKYGQNRSFYLNGQLTKEPNLDKAMATVYNDMYILAVNDKLYILDGLQPVQTDKSMPYATRQYVGFYCTNVPANIIFTQDDALWFGTTDGKICKFATDVEDLNSYNDDGKPIYCCWETPDLDGKLFYKNKTFRYIAIRMMKAIKTSVVLKAMKKGAWQDIKEDSSSGILFDFENIDFELFSFSTDNSEKVSHAKMRVKKVDKARFKAENGNLNEPFGLFNFALEYIESGNYKG